MRLLAAVFAAALQAPAAGPPLPHVDAGACPFECCVYREWTAEEKLIAYESHDSASRGRALFTIAPGERVTALTGLVRTRVAGEVLITAETTVRSLSHQSPADPGETLTFRPGERVYLLVPRGEGWMSGWYGGRMLDEFDATSFGRPEECATRRTCTGTIERKAEFDWWAKVRNAQGHIGWVLIPRDRRVFSGNDACGRP